MLNTQLKLVDTYMTTFLEDGLKAIEDAITPEHLHVVHDSQVMQAGVTAFVYLLGPKNFRWLYTHHTYCVIPLLKELGTFYLQCRHREEEGLFQPIHLEASFVATVAMWLIAEYSDEQDGVLKPTVANRRADEIAKRLTDDQDTQQGVRDALRHHYRLYIRDDIYRSARRAIPVRGVRSAGVAAKVIPLHRNK